MPAQPGAKMQDYDVVHVGAPIREQLHTQLFEAAAKYFANES